jgi:hypothetical protein
MKKKTAVEMATPIATIRIYTGEVQSATKLDVIVLGRESKYNRKNLSTNCLK